MGYKHLYDIEHEDGREWNREEYDKYIIDHLKREPKDSKLWTVAVGPFGQVYLLDNCSTWYEVKEDAAVAWDEAIKSPTEEELCEWAVTIESFVGDVRRIIDDSGSGKLRHEMNLMEKYAKRISELVDG